MPDHKTFVGRHGKNVFSPRLTRVFRIATIYSHAGPCCNRLLIFSRSAQIDSADGAANSVLFAVRIAANEAQRIQTAIKKSGLKKPDWARNALLSAAGG
jgi:hypothetical protein